MKITRCRLNKKIQCRLLEFFILKVSARSATDILGIQPNSATLFYRKIRQVIAFHLVQEIAGVFKGEVESMRATSVKFVKANEVVALLKKLSSLVC